MSRHTVLLDYTGRKSGRRFSLPVNYIERDGRLLLTTDSPWWHNFEQPAPVNVRLRGRQLVGTARAHPDPDLVAEGLRAMVAAQPSYARWAAIGGCPTGPLIPHR